LILPDNPNLSDIKTRTPNRTKTRRSSPTLSSDVASRVIRRPVDYSHYVARNLLDPLHPNPDDFFQGILHYIFFHSSNLYNVHELTLQCAGRQPNSDPASILDAHSPDLYESGNGSGQCVVLNFHRIAIRPTALAIRSGPLNRTTRHLTSYVFQGRMDGGDWTVLDERHSMLEYLPGYPSRLSHIDTNSEFNQFRLLQTDRSASPATHFSINALEIHGRIRMTKPADLPEPAFVIPDDFDPWGIPDYA
jgi:hypothetical protein